MAAKSTITSENSTDRVTYTITVKLTSGELRFVSNASNPTGSPSQRHFSFCFSSYERSVYWDRVKVFSDAAILAAKSSVTSVTVQETKVITNEKTYVVADNRRPRRTKA